MRELSRTEAEIFFAKLAKYIGDNIDALLTRKDEPYCFRVIKNRVYYMSENISKYCNTFKKDLLIGAGIQMGKFTHNSHFRLKITALPILALFAPNKVWLTQAGELSYLYRNDIYRSNIVRMTETMPENVGVIICSHDDQAIGFGVSTKSAIDALRSEPSTRIVIHQADVGEYLRDQDTMF